MIQIICIACILYSINLRAEDGTENSLPQEISTEEVENHATEDAESILVNQSTHLIFRRYYFIARLEKTISLLKEIVQNASTSTMHRISYCKDMPQFSHKSLIQSAYRMRKSKSLKPILVVWDDFSAYKSLEAEIVIGKDDLFVKEFSQQLFFVAKNILSVTKPNTYRTIHHTDITHASTEHILDSLDYLVDLAHMQDGIDAKNIGYKIHQDIKIHASTDEINLRFYQLQRLAPIIDLINQHNQVNAGTYKSPGESIESGWAQMTQYRRIGDQDYVRNFCILLFKVMKGIAQNKPVETEDLSFLSQLNIEEILYGMDVIADELYNLQEAYDGQDSLTFTEWVQKNWWLPFEAAGTAILKILNFHYSGEK